jgi:hypothetical protein
MKSVNPTHVIKARISRYALVLKFTITKDKINRYNGSQKNLFLNKGNRTSNTGLANLLFMNQNKLWSRSIISNVNAIILRITIF